jgi:hypothetical protein
MKQTCRYGKCQTEALIIKFSKVVKTLEEIFELEEKFGIELENGLSA